MGLGRGVTREHVRMDLRLRNNEAPGQKDRFTFPAHNLTARLQLFLNRYNYLCHITMLVGGRVTEHMAPSPSQMGLFKSEGLTQPGNLEVLTKLPGKWIHPLRELILDIANSQHRRVSSFFFLATTPFIASCQVRVARFGSAASR